jgi:hypothetical protein
MNDSLARFRTSISTVIRRSDRRRALHGSQGIVAIPAAIDPGMDAPRGHRHRAEHADGGVAFK